MGDGKFEALRQSGVSAKAVDALERHVGAAADGELCRINALDFGKQYGLTDDQSIDVFLHAAKRGLFEMSWNLLCKGCGSVMSTAEHLRQMTDEHPLCELCSVGVPLSLDELVEVSFTVSPTVRRIAAHDPASMTMWNYTRQLYFSPSLQLPKGEEWDAMSQEMSLADDVIPPGSRVVLQLTLPHHYVIVFDAYNHLGCHLDVKGEPVKTRQEV